MISIWFFIGIALLVNGALIFGAGLFEIWNPPAQQVVLFNLHASVWWGGLLCLAGLAYCYAYLPGKVKE
jgi:hypothetical protein